MRGNINHPIRPDGHLSYLGKVNHLAAPPPFFFARPLTPLGSSPEGELLLADILICPESVLAISLMGALYGSTTPCSLRSLPPLTRWAGDFSMLLVFLIGALNV